MKRFDFIKSLLVAPILIKQFFNNSAPIIEINPYSLLILDKKDSSFDKVAMSYKLTFPNGRIEHFNETGNSEKDVIEKINNKLKFI